MSKLFDVNAVLKAQEEANKPIYNVLGEPTGAHVAAEGIAEIIEQIRAGHTAHYMTDGAWSHYQLIAALVEYLAGCDMLVSSYAMSEQAVRTIAGLIDDGKVRSLQCVIDNRIETRTAGSLQLLQSIASRCVLIHCHAKVTVLLGEGLCITVIGSANYTENKRMEIGMVTTCERVATFHTGWIYQKLADHG